jgi:ATP-dependent RNA helicase RhlE
MTEADVVGVQMSFSDLGLSEAILRAVVEQGYTEPTPIQAKAIPAVMSGGDLLAGAQTGTGKTAGFVLPILQRLTTTEPLHPGAAGRQPIRTLILTPTRELAAQVEQSVRDYAKYVKVSSTTVFGGVNINPQIDRLRRGVDILVATPGRLLDHVQQRTVDLSRVEVLVLDEADRMLDMGFIHDIKRVLKLLPQKRQNLLFSATFSEEIKSLAGGLLNKPAMIEVARRNTTAENVDQRVIEVDRARKRDLLSHLISTHNWFQVLVFTRTKHGANRLAEQLLKDGIPSLAIHGNKSQSARTRALAEFKAGKLQALVATDIAARGLDIVDLPHVVNFDLPNVSEDYVHRIGRTGRAGANGEAISLVSSDERGLMRDIERLIARQLPRERIAGFEPDPNARNEPEVDDRPPRPARGGARPGSRPGQSGPRPGQSGARPAAAGGRPAGAGAVSGAARRPGGRAAAPANWSAGPERGVAHERSGAAAERGQVPAGRSGSAARGFGGGNAEGLRSRPPRSGR